MNPYSGTEQRDSRPSRRLRRSLLRGGLALAGLTLGVGAILFAGASGSSASCPGPLVEVEPTATRGGQHVRVDGQYFGTGCADAGGASDFREFGEPADDIELRFEQAGRSTVMTVVDAADDYTISTVVQLPEDSAPGAAEIRATVRDPQSQGSPPDGLARVEIVSDGRFTIRLEGADRISTAVAISRRAFPDAAAVVYLARSDVPFDALAAGSLQDGPILLVPSCGPLPPVVAEEVRRLRPGMVASLGGRAAVCDAVLQEAAGS